MSEAATKTVLFAGSDAATYGRLADAVRGAGIEAVQIEVDGELSVGAGIGFRWSTPIGLVWGDVAWPVANEGISSTKPKFYFGIGRPF